MSACAPFQAELERALAGSSGVGLARLAGHEHARACADCRAELLRERGLERLLECVPAPEVPNSLARRILARLARERMGTACFSGDGALVDGVLRGEDVRLGDTELEELLGRLPAPRVPAGLAGRVLRSLGPAREPRRARSSRRVWLLSAAAALLAGLAFWGWTVLRPATPRVDLAQGAGAGLEDDEELLAYAVERWELLQDEDLDLWLASLDPVDELLLEFADDETWLDDGSHEAPAREGSDER